MIDVWMIFTMVVPFLEVVMLSIQHISKKGGLSPTRTLQGTDLSCQDDPVFLAVVPNGLSPNTQRWWSTLRQLVAHSILPLAYLLFISLYWTVGLYFKAFPTINIWQEEESCIYPI